MSCRIAVVASRVRPSARHPMEVLAILVAVTNLVLNSMLTDTLVEGEDCLDQATWVAGHCLDRH